MDHIESLEDLVHTVLVLIHGANSPHIVIFGRYAIFCREWTEGSHSLQSHQLLWKLVFDENTTLRSSEVGSPLSQRLTIKRLVNYANPRSAVYCHANHARYMIQMAFCKAFRSIKWVNPNDHLFLKKLVRELIVVVVGLWSRHAVYLLHLLQVLPVSVPLHIVILYEHLLANVVLVELIGHDVWPLSRYLVHVLILFPNNSGSWVKLGQVVHDSILDVNIDLGEDIRGTLALLHGNVGETRNFSDPMNDLISTFEQLDASRHELVQFHHSLHFCPAFFFNCN